ncbi:MAG: hypothetical protein PHH48_06400 [Eubacteriales bacterium]|nr:hypothetical protein [Eubacteriales bacterium]
MARKEDDTSIPLKKTTRERLGTFGNKNESWDRLLNRLMDKLETSLTKEELTALYRITSNVDSYDTEDEELTEAVRTANKKLYRMTIV